MKMNAASIKNQKAEWEALGVKLPAFDHEAMTAKTKEHPVWVHFGAGNIFRGFIAALQQRLLNEGLQDRGIIAADTFDYDIIDKIYTPFDNLTMMVTLNPDGSTSREIIGSVAEGLRADSSDAAMMARFKEIFTDPGLQMISFTITEKGYALYRPDGSLMPVVQADIDEGPAHARHAMSMVAALLFSGLYDLAPLRYSYLQPQIQFDEGIIQRNSPAFRVRACPTPTWITWGGDETSEFARQSDMLHTASQALGNPTKLAPIPDTDHFTVIHGLESPDSAVSRWLSQTLNQNAPV